MSRYSRSQGSNATLVIIILVGGAAWQHKQQLIRIALIALAVTLVALLLNSTLKFALQHKTKPRNVDTLSGLEFEHYVAGLLRKSGFRGVSLTERYDFGVDIVAEKGGLRWGIQAKCYSRLVKASAVRQVVTGLRLYRCDRAMVITNSTFSAVARRLAQANDCVLIDRKALHKLERQKCIL